jgi:hypothetical protein
MAYLFIYVPGTNSVQIKIFLELIEFVKCGEKVSLYRNTKVGT